MGTTQRIAKNGGMGDIGDKVTMARMSRTDTQNRPENTSQNTPAVLGALRLLFYSLALESGPHEGQIDFFVCENEKSIHSYPRPYR